MKMGICPLCFPKLARKKMNPSCLCFVFYTNFSIFLWLAGCFLCLQLLETLVYSNYTALPSSLSLGLSTELTASEQHCYAFCALPFCWLLSFKTPAHLAALLMHSYCFGVEGKGERSLLTLDWQNSESLFSGFSLFSLPEQAQALNREGKAGSRISKTGSERCFSELVC